MATCYYLHNTNVLQSDGLNQQKCGPSTSGAQFCCTNGDTCLEDSICHYTHSEAGGSGYYIGGCTDPRFPEPCSKSCNNLPATDIVFTDASLNLWACCYQHPGANIDCSNPSNETFYAPSPQSLTRQAASSSTTLSSAFASTSLTNSPTSTGFISPPPATPTHAPSSSLSAGGKAGVGVAASIVGLGIIILLGLYLLRKRRPRQHQEARVNKSSGMASWPRTWEQRHALETSAEQQWEMDGNARSEVDGSSRSGLEAR